MTNQKLSLSTVSTGLSLPEKWKKKYLIKRIDEADIEIGEEQRDGILKALQAGTRFVQIGEYTIMLNAIKSIDPKWGKDNIPPKPELEEVFKDELRDGTFYHILVSDNIKEIELWESIYASNKS